MESRFQLVGCCILSLLAIPIGCQHPTSRVDSVTKARIEKANIQQERLVRLVQRERPTVRIPQSLPNQISFTYVLCTTLRGGVFVERKVDALSVYLQQPRKGFKTFKSAGSSCGAEEYLFLEAEEGVNDHLTCFNHGTFEGRIRKEFVSKFQALEERYVDVVVLLRVQCLRFGNTEWERANIEVPMRFEFQSTSQSQSPGASSDSGQK